MSLRFFVLGLLNQHPMSGYDIKQSLKSLNWLIGSPSPGSLYPALRGLLSDGLVTVDVSVRQDRPPRKEYHVTQAGKLALQEWIARPSVPGTLKTFTMRLILASNLTPADLRAHLHQRRSEVARYHGALEQGIAELGSEAELGRRLAFDYGLAVARSELAWLERALDQLARDSVGGQAAGAHTSSTADGENLK